MTRREALSGGDGFPSACAGTLLTLAGNILLRDAAAAAELALKIIDLTINALEDVVPSAPGTVIPSTRRSDSNRKTVSDPACRDPDFRQS